MILEQTTYITSVVAKISRQTGKHQANAFSMGYIFGFENHNIYKKLTLNPVKGAPHIIIFRNVTILSLDSDKSYAETICS